MMNFRYLLLLALMLTTSMLNAQTSNKVLSIYWCGFSSGFCGQSSTDDVYFQATHVIMAYGKISSSGSLSTGTFNSNISGLISQWKSEGKKVLLSFGGPDTDISQAFTSASTLASQINTILNNNNLDGVDFEIKTYNQTPQQIINALSTYRNVLGSSKEIILTTEAIGVVPSNFIPIPGNNQVAENNFMVPVIRGSTNYNYVQVLTYGKVYLTAPAGTSEYIEVVYKSWLNDNPNYQIPNFNGIPESKLIIGVLSSFSTDPANSAFYVTPFSLRTAFSNLFDDNYNPKGINIWNSNNDAALDNSIAISSVQALQLQVQNDPDQGGDSGDQGGDSGGDSGESVEGLCYISQCGCPGNFQLDWCSENSKPPSSFCQAGQRQCEGCDGAWCPGADSGDQGDNGGGQGGDNGGDNGDSGDSGDSGDQGDQGGSGVCYLGECGCPGEFKQNWCGNNSFLSSSWCNENESQCVSCAGAWCVGVDSIVDDTEDQDQDGEDGSIDGCVNRFGMGLFVLFMLVQTFV
ncbi:Glycoside hydrolase, superfamily [Pseudocohnilembus persalinus]|uniref:Glycoside hydrolase, superfamily n=1 Tax=Pseudocohnilembus persalinus TaxID=266149 RepID=A0A0V0QPJ3_PSEPJ|nr:Glycoside hydrolase, superfamily [Pseudocohnilembus persalinus]|eukprot:KRX04108.1 Glycoside hydrolase, superfamily [Pseudocohnilembus persalinus]